MPNRPRVSTRSLPLALLLAFLAGGCQTLKDDDLAGRTIFFPMPPDRPRIQYLTSINYAWDVVPERSGLARFVFGARPDLEGQDLLRRPHGIAVWQGRVYVCDLGSGSVKVFDLQNRTFSILGKNSRVISGPTGIHISEDGTKFVVESMLKMIHLFGPRDNYLASYRIKEGRPSGVAAVGSELFVTDIENDQILVLNRSTGEVVRTLGESGKEPGEFLMPNAITADAEGHLYVSDQMNYRFQKLDRDGTPLLWHGEIGDSYGHFARPRGIAVGPDGIIYVVESVYELVQMFDEKGQVLMAFGNFHPGSSGMELPASVAVDISSLPYFSRYLDPRFEARYLLFVTSQVGKSMVGVYAFGELKEGVPVPALPAFGG